MSNIPHRASGYTPVDRGVYDPQIDRSIPGSGPPVPPPHRQQQGLPHAPHYRQVPPQQRGQPMPHGPGRPMIRPGATGPTPPPVQYRQASVSRARSLTRPERQRPRQGMIRSPSQQRQMQQQQQQQHHAGGMMAPHPSHQQRMSQMHHQQRLRQQQAAGLSAPLPPPVPEKEDLDDDPAIKPKVLTSWWSWVAFLATCCIPSCCIRIVFRKPNALMQQAWREKVMFVCMHAFYYANVIFTFSLHLCILSCFYVVHLPMSLMVYKKPCVLIQFRTFLIQPLSMVNGDLFIVRIHVYMAPFMIWTP